MTGSSKQTETQDNRAALHQILGAKKAERTGAVQSGMPAKPDVQPAGVVSAHYEAKVVSPKGGKGGSPVHQPKARGTSHSSPRAAK